MHYINIFVYSDKRKTFCADSHFSCSCFQYNVKVSIAILVQNVDDKHGYTHFLQAIYSVSTFSDSEWKQILK